MDALLDVTQVQADASYVLHLEFENGERRQFDMRSYLDKKPYLPLKALHLFQQAHIDYGTVVWPGEIDIAPEMLYARSVVEQAPVSA